MKINNNNKYNVNQQKEEGKEEQRQIGVQRKKIKEAVDNAKIQREMPLNNKKMEYWQVKAQKEQEALKKEKKKFREELMKQQQLDAQSIKMQLQNKKQRQEEERKRLLEQHFNKEKEAIEATKEARQQQEEWNKQELEKQKRKEQEEEKQRRQNRRPIKLEKLQSVKLPKIPTFLPQRKHYKKFEPKPKEKLKPIKIIKKQQLWQEPEQEPEQQQLPQRILPTSSSSSKSSSQPSRQLSRQSSKNQVALSEGELNIIQQLEKNNPLGNTTERMNGLKKILIEIKTKAPSIFNKDEVTFDQELQDKTTFIDTVKEYLSDESNYKLFEQYLIKYITDMKLQHQSWLLQATQYMFGTSFLGRKAAGIIHQAIGFFDKMSYPLTKNNENLADNVLKQIMASEVRLAQLEDKNDETYIQQWCEECAIPLLKLVVQSWDYFINPPSKANECGELWFKKRQDILSQKENRTKILSLILKVLATKLSQKCKRYFPTKKDKYDEKFVIRQLILYINKSFSTLEPNLKQYILEWKEVSETVNTQNNMKISQNKSSSWTDKEEIKTDEKQKSPEL